MISQPHTASKRAAAEPMLDFGQRFAELARRLDQAESPEQAHIADTAVAVLRESCDLLNFDPGALLDWALHSRELPQQQWSSDFGSPTVTVYERKGEYKIDVIYWAQLASPIHGHISCGAFACIDGKRLHQMFSLQRHSEYDTTTHSVTLQTEVTEVLGPFEVRRIEPDLIHALYWIEQPSVTISIRCLRHQDEAIKPMEYWSSGLAYLDMVHHSSSLVSRRVAALRLLRLCDGGLYRSSLKDALQEGAPGFAVEAFIDAVRNLESAQIDAVLDELTPRTDSLERWFERAGDEIRRRDLFSGIRFESIDTQTLAALNWASLDAESIETLFDLHCETGETNDTCNARMRRASEELEAHPLVKRWLSGNRSGDFHSGGSKPRSPQ